MWREVVEGSRACGRGWHFPVKWLVQSNSISPVCRGATAMSGATARRAMWLHTTGQAGSLGAGHVHTSWRVSTNQPALTWGRRLLGQAGGRAGRAAAQDKGGHTGTAGCAGADDNAVHKADRGQAPRRCACHNYADTCCRGATAAVHWRGAAVQGRRQSSVAVARQGAATPVAHPAAPAGAALYARKDVNFRTARR